MAIESPARGIENGLLYSEGEFEERRILGILDPAGRKGRPLVPSPTELEQRVERTPIEARDVLNEAYDYARPSSFSRGLRIPMGTVTLLLISGTASIDEEGRTIHVGDFRAQC